MESMERECVPRDAAEPNILNMLALAMLPIGDTIWLAPTLRALRERYPHAHVTLLTHVTNAPLARCLPGVDAVVVLPALSSLRPLARVLCVLRARHFDIAINFTSPAYAWIGALAGIPLRAGMKFGRLWWLIPAAHRRWRATHATRHYYDCARELGLPPWERVAHTPRIVLPEAARAEAAAYLAARGITPGERPLIALHPGDGKLRVRKRWPAARFAELADRLRERWGAEIVLLGDGGELALARAIAGDMGTAPIIATGRLPLMSSAALIAMCDLFIGNDSGLLHLAAATGTHYVGIYGPTWLANFGPVPVCSRQGLLATPAIACDEPRYFVGGDVVWRRRRCRGTCRALEGLGVADVLARAECILGSRAMAEAGAV